MIEMQFDVNDDSLRNKFFIDTLPQAVKNLTQDTTPSWGKMSAHQMIEHLLWTIKISIGTIDVPCSTPESVLPRIKTFLHNNKEMSHDFKNPLIGENLPALQYATFAEAKTALLEEINRFLDYYQSHPEAIHIHPVFGPLGKDEWQRIHFKHFFHHFLQFCMMKDSVQGIAQQRISTVQ